MDTVVKRIGRATYRTSVEGLGVVTPPDDVFVTDHVAGALPTNKWWSSALWKRYSSSMYPHPLAVKAIREGLIIDYPEVRVEHNGEGLQIDALLREGAGSLIVGGDCFSAESAKVDGYGDWSVDLLFHSEDGNAAMKAVLAHGSPFVYFYYEGMNPVITFQHVPDIWVGNVEEGDHALAISAGDRYYGLFAPAGTRWTSDRCRLVAHLPEGKHYLSVAVLPDNQLSVFEHYRKHAYVFIQDTLTEWSYDEKSGTVDTHFSVKTNVMEGDCQETLLALYPHQWKYTDAALLPYIYRSPRGDMKVIEGTRFSTRMQYGGLLPFLPAAGLDESTLKKLLDIDLREMKPMNAGQNNTYWSGKWFGKLAQLIWITQATGQTEISQLLLQRLKADMEEWFLPAADRAASKFFYYDRKWGTVIGYPSGFGADSCMNDHHFHYGYWVYAAAVIAFHDPEWAGREQMGGMIEMLLQDYANWDRTLSAFPYLRHFDSYAGHSWASGRAMDLYASDGTLIAEPGNNQESSSEAIYAWTAMILWGLATGNDAIRDAGVYMYTTEVHAAWDYWFDVEKQLLPPDYNFGYIPILFSAGAQYRVWWETSRLEEFIGINILPVTASSLYLAHHPDYAKQLYANMVQRLGRAETYWQDIFWEYIALFDADAAFEKWSAIDVTPEFGESRTHTYQWIAAMRELGQIDPSVTANTTCYAVFNKDNVRTYIAFNAVNQSKEVVFADRSGDRTVKMTVPALSVAVLSSEGINK